MRQNKKRKLIWKMLPHAAKLLLYFVVLPLGALMGARYISFAIEGYEVIPREHLRLMAMIDGLQTDRHTLFIFIGIILIIGVVILFFSMGGNKSNNFQSEMMEITDTIKTPKAIGQSQHGSAKWLTEGQINKTFSVFILDRKKNKLIKSLIAKGRIAKADMQIQKTKALSQVATEDKK